MTKPTGNPKGRPVTIPEKGKKIEDLVEDKVLQSEFLCYACSAVQTFRFKFCPLCGVENRWE